MILCSMMLCALFAAPHPQSAPKYAVEVTSPEPGKSISYLYYEISISLQVTAPPGEYEVELRYGGITHYLPAFREQGSLGKDGLKRWGLRDRWLLFELGEHPLQLRLLSLDAASVDGIGTVLAETNTTLFFTVNEKYPPSEQVKQRLENLGNGGIYAAEVLEPVTEPYRNDKHSDFEHKSEQASKWLKAKTKWLRQRIDALAEIAEIYEYTGRPGDGLKLLRMAETLWNTESKVILNRPPMQPQPQGWEAENMVFVPRHIGYLESFYARRMELEPAMKYLQQSLDHYDEQYKSNPLLSERERRRCHEQAGFVMLRAAQLHYLLRRDRAGYDKWMKRAKEMFPPREKD